VEEDGGRSEPPATFKSALEGICTLRKYLMQFDVDNMMVAISSMENKVYRFQQKAKQQQQLTLMDMWKK
jgi:hypothetical protein